jgi:hypothetical protein
MSDHEQHDRYERWIADLATYLGEQGVACVCGFDDRHMGDIMFMSIPGQAGYSELVVLRGKRQKAITLILSETAAAARDLARVMSAAHRHVRRARNAKRKFWHLVENMADRLARHFDSWASDYPQQTLARLQQAIPEAQAQRMIGSAAHRHVKARDNHDEVQYGASVATNDPDAGGPPRRALRYNNARAAFEGQGQALHAVQSRALAAGVDVGELVVASALASAVLGAGTLDVNHEVEQRKQSLWDSCDCGLDVLDCGLVPWDCASGASDIGCETPDCDSCDVPDCSFDCGL